MNANSVCVCVCVCMLSHVWLLATSWTIAHQAPLSMKSSRQEYWCGLPFPPPGNLPSPRIEPVSWGSSIGRENLYHWDTWKVLNANQFLSFYPSAQDSDSKEGTTYWPSLPHQSSSWLAEKSGPEKSHLITSSGEEEIPPKVTFGKESGC